jgi:hypothetical protein
MISAKLRRGGIRRCTSARTSERSGGSACRVALELAEDGDVARVADLLGQVGRVEDVLGLEVGVGLGALQVAQVHAQAEVLQALVDEAGVARFVARHVAHQRLDVGVVTFFWISL